MARKQPQLARKQGGERKLAHHLEIDARPQLD